MHGGSAATLVRCVQRRALLLIDLKPKGEPYLHDVQVDPRGYLALLEAARMSAGRMEVPR
jgi:hypothetical protein